MNTFTEVNAATQRTIKHLILTQVGMKKGIKLWGEEGVAANIKEMKQFHDKGVVEPLKPSDISDDIRKKALGYLMFFLKKRNGIIKGRGCADGRPQRVHKSKEETCSPTAVTESVFITALLDAQEGRDVAHVDTPGTFLQTEASDDTSIKLEGSIVRITTKINPEWKQYIVYEGKKSVLTIYSKAIKAYMGQWMQLNYDNLSHVLTKELGFKKNDYDSCVANKLINGKQCTIVFHVDNLKISHDDPEVVTSIITELDNRYGDIMPLTISRGKIHEYLGMIFDYTIASTVKITMY